MKPFPHNPELSCAGCHSPSAAFVDHRQHDVGSGGLFRTPTLRNANFNAPYFHDGRFDTFDQVVAHFDRSFALGLADQERSDLVAYLTAVGDGEQAIEPDPLGAAIAEITDFSSTLDTAIAARNLPVIGLVVDTIGLELRELTEWFPDRRNTAVSGGIVERNIARAGLKELVMKLRRVDCAAHDDKFDTALDEYRQFRDALAAALPTLRRAEPWSLFDPSVHDAHYAAVRNLLQAARAGQR